MTLPGLWHGQPHCLPKEEPGPKAFSVGGVSSVIFGIRDDGISKYIASTSCAVSNGLGRAISGRGQMAVKPPMPDSPPTGDVDFFAADLGSGPYSQILMLEKCNLHFPQTGRFSSHLVEVSAKGIVLKGRSEPLLSSPYMPDSPS